MFAHYKEGKLSRLAVRSIIVAFALALAGAFSAAPALAHNPAIVTRNGPVKGVSIFGVEGYLGIPYAVPPVGDLRCPPPPSRAPSSPNRAALGLDHVIDDHLPCAK